MGDNEELLHYGTPHSGNTSHSGRYEWGSGENAYQRDQDFLSIYRKMHAEGASNAKIAEYLRENVKGYEHFTTKDLVAKNSIVAAQDRAANIARAQRLKKHGYSNATIAQMMGLGASQESTIRTWLKASEASQKTKLEGTADILEENVKKKGFVDIGAGVEYDLGVTRTNLDTAAAMLKEKGYEVYNVYASQPNNPGQKTTIKVIAPPGTEWKDVMFNQDKIKSITDYSPDGGKTFNVSEYPSSIDSSRIKVRYAEEGGTAKDGVIEIRRGVKDLSLGSSNYAQVRIAIDGTHYMKGMAMYSDDIPEGYDILVNSNKHIGTVLKPETKKVEGVFKLLKNDPDMPFGSAIKAGGQSYYDDPDGEYVKTVDGKFRKATAKDGDAARFSLSPVNKLREEGEWDTWSKTVSAQMLSKQTEPLIQRQLTYSFEEKKAAFDEIMALENPAVKQSLLNEFASECDSSSVDLKAASFPRQSSRVILPCDKIPETEVYAPTYRNGEHVVLIRYPHAGRFEIPELIVNNNNPEAKRLFGNAKDAIGINSKTAGVLSGADFDGDSVVVIPVNERVRIATKKPFEGLKDFNPTEAYPGYEGMPDMKDRTKQMQMGIVSNLITDMTLKGANDSELERAVRHSMVIIDAQKHHLNYKQSYIDNGIEALKKRYQYDEETGHVGGASTLISRAGSEKDVAERKYNWKANEEGEREYTETGRTYNKLVNILDDGTKVYKEVEARQKVSKMSDTKDAKTLSSGTKIEEIYADYANKLKSLANQARKEALAIKPVEVDKEAAKKYKAEVDQLKADLEIALTNAPKERQALLLANKTIARKTAENPELWTDKDQLKKVKNRAMAEARMQVGAGKKRITITDREWEAIQAHAISTNTLKKILLNTDMDVVKKYATPRTTNEIPTAKQNAISSMYKSGFYTISEIADKLGISTSTVSKYTA